MSDSRRTAANARVCAADLAAQFPDLKPVLGTTARIALPVVDLLRRPDGPRDRQLLCGEAVTVFDNIQGWAFVQAAKDAYVGYLPTDALAPAQDATHWVSAAASHAYCKADFKSRDRCGLSFGSLVRVTGNDPRFAATDQGFIPRVHLSPIGQYEADPVAIAERFLGTPYLWGGNSRFGIDCSGLVQAAFLACGSACPGDSDQQEAECGLRLPVDSPYQRGDLLFWKGHVALVRDAETLIHANAHAMAVAIEPLQAAIFRIAEQGDGPVTAHKRPG
ncbi:NlpC/P60 family protein [Pseudophaeobacter sp.]|uniref:C40 family peptidase n=1 Tax=Pseudophaeobacter sp. TaxID=1971739 RepID=UPI003297AFA8